jgi:hypothetical protein
MLYGLVKVTEVLEEYTASIFRIKVIYSMTFQSTVLLRKDWNKNELSGKYKAQLDLVFQ